MGDKSVIKKLAKYYMIFVVLKTIAKIILAILVGVLLIIVTQNLVNIGGNNDANSSISGTVNDEEIKNVMAMTDEQVWKGLTGGVISQRPADKHPSNESAINAGVAEQLVDITIPIRVWSNGSGMGTKQDHMTIKVNKLLSGVWLAFFTDVYNEAPDFVIDRSTTGGYGTRGGSTGMQSGHPYGAAVDINWDTVGNRYEDTPYTETKWKSLKQSHSKYQVIYQNSAIVQIAHKYTLCWGGDWRHPRDGMHFSFIGDWSRSELIKKYGN